MMRTYVPASCDVDPARVAGLALDGLQSGALEVVADDKSRGARAALYGDLTRLLPSAGAEQGGERVAVVARDDVELDALRAHGRALADVGAAAEALGVHRAATMSSTRASRSGWPCGSRPRWVTLAAVNSMAEPLGQAATQAPQPMQVAASKARSASGFGTGMAFASGADPVGAVM